MLWLDQAAEATAAIALLSAAALGLRKIIRIMSKPAKGFFSKAVNLSYSSNAPSKLGVFSEHTIA
jgi:hypothetical protein